MSETNEAEIPPPFNPLTKALNLQVLRFVAARFMEQYLPAYMQVVTSDIRTAEHNAAVGGADNSAHLHGLAEDFQLMYKNGRTALTQSQAKAIYDQYVAPHWPGYTEFEAASAGEGYHIHWNLPRTVSTYTGMVTVAGIGVVGFALINKLSIGKG